MLGNDFMKPLADQKQYRAEGVATLVSACDADQGECRRSDSGRFRRKAARTVLRRIGVVTRQS